MALIVKVYINNRCIINTNAVRIMGKPHKQCVYKTDTNHMITHHYDDGGAALAIKLLEVYNDPVKAAIGQHKNGVIQ